MYIGDSIGTEEVCLLLGISRPTLRSYRNKFGVSSEKIKKEVIFSKNEILNKLYVQLNPLGEKIDFNMHTKSNISSLKIDDTSYDLRRLDLPDGHGAISLLCHLISEIKEGKYLHLLIDQSNTFLKAMNFFVELKRYFNSNVFWCEDVFDSIESVDYSFIKLPIRRLGVVGAHATVADDLVLSLSKQGYSIDICSYIGWAMGELADNAATHAKVHPSFVYFEQFGEDRRYLQFTIGDTGIGIPESLRSNESYTHLNDAQALLTAFKPHVSGRDDSEKRGKGLTDVLKIAMECGSSLRVESNRIGYSYLFNAGLDDFDCIVPLYQASGTIISIMFIDGSFGSLEWDDVGIYIDKCLEKV